MLLLLLLYVFHLVVIDLNNDFIKTISNEKSDNIAKLAKRNKASQFVGKHESPSSKRNKACQSLMKASDLVSDLHARS